MKIFLISALMACVLSTPAMAIFEDGYDDNDWIKEDAVYVNEFNGWLVIGRAEEDEPVQ